MFALKEYYLNPFLESTTNRFITTTSGFGEESDKTIQTIFSSTFTLGPKCPPPYTYQGTATINHVQIRASFQPLNQLNVPTGSVLLTSIFTQFTSSSASNRFIQQYGWRYSATQSNWTQTNNNLTDLDENQFYKLLTPLIVSRIYISQTGNQLNLCAAQMFGYAFCQVTALAAVNLTVDPQPPSTGTSITFVNPGFNITFKTTATAQLDTGLSNNEFCSLSLQIIVSLNGDSKNITFAVDSSSGQLTPTVSTWILNGVSQTMTFTLDPSTLLVTGVLLDSNIFATTDGLLVVEWQAIDSRDNSATAISAPNYFTVGYTCIPLGLSTGSLSFQDSNLSDNSTYIYNSGQGITTIQFVKKSPYCQRFTGETFIGYYYDSIANAYVMMNTDMISFEKCRITNQAGCLMWSQAQQQVSYFSQSGTVSPLLIKIEVIFNGLGMLGNAKNLTINRFLYIRAVDSCKNTVVEYQVFQNNQPYTQKLSFFTDSRLAQSSTYQVITQDSCSYSNSSNCNGIKDCGLYYYSLTADTTDSNYQLAQNLLDSGSDLLTDVSSDTKSFTLLIQSSNKIYTGQLLVFNLVIGLVNFQQSYPNLDPKQTQTLTITFLDFYPKATTVNFVYHLGYANKKITLAQYVISPSKYKVTNITTQQMSGITIPVTQYYLNTTALTFTLQTDNQVFANTVVVFNFTATLNDPLSTKNSDLLLIISFVTVDLADILKHNSPPYFTAAFPIPAQILCLSSNSAQFWNFNFPPATDDQSNTISLRIDCKGINSNVFLIKEYKTQVFTLQLNTSFPAFGPPGQVSCKAVLSDNYKSSKQYDMIFNNLCSNNDWNGNLNQSNKNATLIALQPRISQITRQGQVTLTWNVKMVPPLKTSKEQESHTCYSQPSVKVVVVTKSFKEQKMNLNFTISNLSYFQNQTQFTIIFQDPQDVSFYTADTIKVTFNNTACFQSIQKNFIDGNVSLVSQLPKQMSREVIEISNQIPAIAKAVMYTSVSMVMLSFFTQTVFSFLLSMISNISFILHMFLVVLNYPVNLQSYLNIFFPIITFAIIPTTQIFETMFHFSDIQTDYAITDQFNAVGYSSIFCINNLGFLYLTIQFGFALIIIFWVITRLQIFSNRKKLQKFVDDLTKQFFWNGIIQFCSQNYLLICVVSFIESNDLRISPEYTATEIYCSILAISGMVFAFAFPITVFLIYRKAVKPENLKFTIPEKAQIIFQYQLGFDDFEKQEFMYFSKAYRIFIDSYGTLLQDIDIAKTGPTIAVLCPLVDLTAQLCLAVAVTRLVNWPIFQIFLFNFILQAYLMFFVYFSPYKQKSKQFWCIFDKIILLGLNYHMMLFTDFVTDSDNYAQIANSVIYIISGCSILRVWFELTVTVQSLLKYARQTYVNYLLRKHSQQTDFLSDIKKKNIKPILKKNKKQNFQQQKNSIQVDSKVQKLPKTVTFKHDLESQNQKRINDDNNETPTSNRKLKSRQSPREQLNQKHNYSKQQTALNTIQAVVKKKDPLQSKIQVWQLETVPVNEKQEALINSQRQAQIQKKHQAKIQKEQQAQIYRDQQEAKIQRQQQEIIEREQKAQIQRELEARIQRELAEGGLPPTMSPYYDPVKEFLKGKTLDQIYNPRNPLEDFRDYDENTSFPDMNQSNAQMQQNNQLIVQQTTTLVEMKPKVQVKMKEKGIQAAVPLEMAQERYERISELLQRGKILMP